MKFSDVLRKGMTADDVVKIVQEQGFTLQNAEKLGNNKFGLIAKWTFKEGFLIFERKEHPGPYIVVSVRDKQEDKKS